ncbi:MAG: 7-cyano-7-deazaguanine synthase [Planctomycetes bacterium]|nr:7-cyano-7-deazaguanine synthase [Planctomycetota bacterium]
MGIVNLASGGLDSSLISILALEQNISVFPLFIDYGQRSVEMEWKACCNVHEKIKTPEPIRMDISGFGKVILSGLTSELLYIRENAFTPCRNLLFLVAGASYAYQLGVDSVAIGLLSEQFSLFPDQREDFIRSAEDTITSALGKKINITTPLSEFSKDDVVKLAHQKGLTNTYSCHAGGLRACGKCISCLEFQNNKKRGD